MKKLLLICSLVWNVACDGSSSSQTGAAADTMAPREATDPVPAPPAEIDTTQTSTLDYPQTQTVAVEELYRITGTEPFWSLTLGKPYSLYRSMSGDSIRFDYEPPVQAQGRQEEWVQLFKLGNEAWVVLRKGNAPCSDGMSDKQYTYWATLWLKGQLLDGCGEKK